MGHPMAEHIAKQQQAVAGALIAGTLMATAGAYCGYRADAPSTAIRRDMENAMAAGAAVGGMAYSQTFEPVAATIGAHVARAAGCDPVGARACTPARRRRTTATDRCPSGGTHPPSEKRIATARAPDRESRAGQGRRAKR